MTEDFTNLCKRLEHFETPEWAARAILDKEALSGIVMERWKVNEQEPNYTIISRRYAEHVAVMARLVLMAVTFREFVAGGG